MESCETDRLLDARIVLKNSIEKSRNMGIAINELGSRLEKSSHNFAVLQTAMKDMACKCSFDEIRGQVDRTIGPATAVLKVVEVVHSLKDSLENDPCTDLYVYLATIRRLEDALKLLANNCRLVILWLEDVVQFLVKNAAAVDERYVMNVKKSLKILMELQGKEESFRQIGGVLPLALDKLESRYKHVLADSTSIEPFSFPSHIVQELQAITRVLASNNRLKKCVSIYMEIRVATLRANLQSLDLDYLDIQLSEFDSVEMIEGHVDLWDNHMEFVVRSLLKTEYKLCNEVYGKFESDICMKCFANISIQCGFLDILKFGGAVTKCKKEAAKLLPLLKIFATLDKLRLDFNEVFNGKYFIEIQNQTRNLVKRVVDGACEIFWELSLQVELQRASSPPADGSVPRLVRFVVEYCNQILENENRLFLVRMLEIYKVWNGAEFNEGLLSGELRKIMKILVTNLEIWAKSYDDTALSGVFMMNNHWYVGINSPVSRNLNTMSNKSPTWALENIKALLSRYLYENVKGTNLGDLMGRSWLSQRVETVEYYSTLYMKGSWEKLLVLLGEDDLFLFPGGRAVDRNLVKKRISVFCEAFDGICQKQSKWIMSDESLRRKTCQLIIEAIVPPYKSYIQRYMPELEHETESTEKLIGLLFQPKLGKFGSRKCTDLTGIKHDGTNRFSSAPAAA